MYESHYNIAGISVVIIAKSKLADDNAYELYRTDGITSEQVYQITMEPSANRPNPSEICFFQNELNWVFDGPVPLHFFRVPFGKAPCAWDYLGNGTEKKIFYLPEAEPYFSTSLGVFNASGFERILYQFRKFLFHCSYVDAQGKAILFSAPSGGGKTTQGLLWEKYADATMINGDRAVLEIDDQNVICHGLPIAGSSGVFINRSLPLKAIFVLKKSAHNRVQQLTGLDAFQAVFSELTINMWNPAFVSDAMDFVNELISIVPIYQLECTISQDAVEAAREVMK